mmetsp:Transcript_17317/g.47689  ORF Transcript_17317/g.47689 Transcript_17317/m.47689 type:complete len:93 (+) Transcript_17317:403-681(+)
MRWCEQRLGDNSGCHLSSVMCGASASFSCPIKRLQGILSNQGGSHTSLRFSTSLRIGGNAIYRAQVYLHRHLQSSADPLSPPHAQPATKRSE